MLPIWFHYFRWTVSLFTVFFEGVMIFQLHRHRTGFFYRLFNFVLLTDLLPYANAGVFSVLVERVNNREFDRILLVQITFAPLLLGISITAHLVLIADRLLLMRMPLISKRIHEDAGILKKLFAVCILVPALFMSPHFLSMLMNPRYRTLGDDFEDFETMVHDKYDDIVGLVVLVAVVGLLIEYRFREGRQKLTEEERNMIVAILFVHGIFLSEQVYNAVFDYIFVPILMSLPPYLVMTSWIFKVAFTVHRFKDLHNAFYFWGYLIWSRDIRHIFYTQVLRQGSKEGVDQTNEESPKQNTEQLENGVMNITNEFFENSQEEEEPVVCSSETAASNTLIDI